VPLNNNYLRSNFAFSATSPIAGIVRTKLIESATNHRLPAPVYATINSSMHGKTPNLMGMLLNITLNNNGKRGA